MRDRATRVPRGGVLHADVCVVGAGPAGITLALALSGKGLSVLLLEAGDQPLDARAQALYAGEVAPGRRHPPADTGRARGLGGTSPLWHGRCAPLDPIDFETRAHVPHSGWPISHGGLQPWYAKANTLLEAGRYEYDARSALPGTPPLVAALEGSALQAHGIDRWSCPTDFGRRYGRRLEVAPDVRVLAGAHCTAVRLDADASTVRLLDVATLDGNRFQVAAQAVVLAAGALETARLLLASNDVMPQGVGNRYDVVGRYLQTRLAGRVATLVLHGDGDPQPVRAPDGTPCTPRLGLDALYQRELGLLNAALRLETPLAADPAHGSAVLSGRFLLQALRREVDRDGAPVSPDLLGSHVLNLFREPAATARWLQGSVRARMAARREPPRLPPMRTRRYTVAVQAEQQPLASSRVQLADEPDMLGMRRLRVDWRHCQADIESVGRTLEMAAVEFTRTESGRLLVDRDSLADNLLRDGPPPGLHVGTARMGRDPSTSVVDPECRVHGVRNLYVAGGAVFPTCGHADPMLTLVALSLRLGERLVQRLQPRRAATAEVFA
ncbi:MAG: GMC family oxidoreductase [Comamonadaceae bacterium]|nr:MAG: GMC family oxidoreductase [Comamonadaceae bacterium]